MNILEIRQYRHNDVIISSIKRWRSKNHAKNHKPNNVCKQLLVAIEGAGTGTFVRQCFIYFIFRRKNRINEVK